MSSGKRGIALNRVPQAGPYHFQTISYKDQLIKERENLHELSKKFVSLSQNFQQPEGRLKELVEKRTEQQHQQSKSYTIAKESTAFQQTKYRSYGMTQDSGNHIGHQSNNNKAFQWNYTPSSDFIKVPVVPINLMDSSLERAKLDSAFQEQRLRIKSKQEKYSQRPVTQRTESSTINEEEQVSQVSFKIIKKEELLKRPILSKQNKQTSNKIQELNHQLETLAKENSQLKENQTKMQQQRERELKEWTNSKQRIHELETESSGLMQQKDSLEGKEKVQSRLINELTGTKETYEKQNKRLQGQLDFLKKNNQLGVDLQIVINDLTNRLAIAEKQKADAELTNHKIEEFSRNKIESLQQSVATLQKEALWNDKCLREQQQSIKQTVSSNQNIKSKQKVIAQLRRFVTELQCHKEESEKQVQNMRNQLKETLLINERNQSSSKQVQQLKRTIQRLQRQHKNLQIVHKYQQDTLTRKLQDKQKETEESMLKLKKAMYFQQDLIHFNQIEELKAQVVHLKKENSQLVEEHMRFVEDIRKIRLVTDESLTIAQKELVKVKEVYSGLQRQIDRINCMNEDKLQLIKLQTEVSYLKRKNQEHLKTIIESQIEIKELKEQMGDQSKKYGTLQNLNESCTMQEIKDSIAVYETRGEQMNELMKLKDTDIQKQKHLVEVFKKELIKMREEKHITEMKSKQVEQNLRSDIEELRRNLERELQIHTSKCNNLEAALSRKNKEIADKDGFIKRFLLGRIKQMEDRSVEEVLHEINKHFTGQ